MQPLQTEVHAEAFSLSAAGKISGEKKGVNNVFSDQFGISGLPVVFNVLKQVLMYFSCWRTLQKCSEDHET